MSRHVASAGNGAASWAGPRRQTTSAALLMLMAVAVAILAVGVPAVSAKNCEARNTLSAWRHSGGMFRRIPSTAAKGTFEWKEFDGSGNVQATFHESMRDLGQQQVVLTDNSRGVSVLLRHDVCGIKGKDDAQFQKLYGGTWVSRWCLHGKLRYPVGSGTLTLGETLLPLLPSNDIFYDPPKLRHRLDKEGYLYLKNVVPREVIDGALDDLALQMRGCGWTLDEDRERQKQRDGFAMGVPYPSHLLPPDFRDDMLSAGHANGKELPAPNITYSERIRSAVSGTSVMSVVRQVFGGAVRASTLQQLHLGAPAEAHPFRMNSVFYNKGTKLCLFGLVPLQDTPMNMGTPLLVRGSNSAAGGYEKIRKTYGQWEVEDDDIFSEDGAYTASPEELLPLGKRIGKSEVTGLPTIVDDNPMLSSALEAGDVLLFTIYTMKSFLTNQTNCWRIFGECCWTMEGDDVGPDPRYVGEAAQGLAGWEAKKAGQDCHKHYPRSLLTAKKDWGLLNAAMDDPSAASSGEPLDAGKAGKT